VADLKISALPASTTPLAGTEVLPIVQSGATKKVSVADLTAGRAISATQLTLTTGNLIVANGQGIDFSATPGTGTSELLNDYEEGTWTPVLARESGGPITATTSDVTAKYTKIGNLVTVSLFLIITAVTSQGTGANEIRGLPFAPTVNALGAGSVGRNDVFTTDVVHNCWVWGDSRIIFSSNVNSASTTAVDWKTGYINLTMTYPI
jgi:hypothetical protein